MTDDRTDPLASADDERDLLASRYVDGDLDAVLRAGAEADPVVMARADAMARVRSHLARPVVVGASVVDAAVAAALAWSEPEAAPSPARVVTFRPRRRVAAALPWLGAVAAGALIVVGVAGLTGGDGGGDLATDATSAPKASAVTEAEPSAATESMAGAAEQSTDRVGADGSQDEDDAGTFADAPADTATATAADTDAPAGTAAPEAVDPPAATEAPAAPRTDAPAAGDTTASGGTIDVTEPYPFPPEGAPIEVRTAEELRWLALWSEPLDGPPACRPDATLLQPAVEYGDPAAGVPVTEVEVVLVESAGATDVVADEVDGCTEAARIPLG